MTKTTTSNAARVAGRKLRVGAQYRPTTNGTVPHLRLTGEWMRRAGFAEGDSITVSIEAGALVIRLDGRAA